MKRSILVSFVLVAVLVALHVRVMLATGGAFELDGLALINFGARWPPAMEAGEWWRLLTAALLHGGLAHIAFNSVALVQVGPPCERIFGPRVFILAFVLSAIAGNVVGLLFGKLGVGVGASGGVMGLIGLLGGWGHREGTELGHTVRNQMLQWAAITIAFGFFAKADNWAHGGGLLVGGAMGMWLTPDVVNGRLRGVVAGVAEVCAALLVGAAIIVAVPLGRYHADEMQFKVDATLDMWREKSSACKGGDADACKFMQDVTEICALPASAMDGTEDERRLISSACGQWRP